MRNQFGLTGRPRCTIFYEYNLGSSVKQAIYNRPPSGADVKCPIANHPFRPCGRGSQLSHHFLGLGLCR
jgi:hypothetical protein